MPQVFNLCNLIFLFAQLSISFLRILSTIFTSYSKQVSSFLFVQAIPSHSDMKHPACTERIPVLSHSIENHLLPRDQQFEVPTRDFRGEKGEGEGGRRGLTQFEE